MVIGLFYHKYHVDNAPIWRIKSLVYFHNQALLEKKNISTSSHLNMGNLGYLINTFLSTVKYFSEIWKLSFLIQNFITLWKFMSIISISSLHIVYLYLLQFYLAKSLNMSKVFLTDFLSFWRVKIELIKTWMQKLIRANNSLLKLCEFLG